MEDRSKQFCINGWEFKGVMLIDPATGDPYKVQGAGGGSSGDASAVNQQTANTLLSGIEAKLPTLIGGAAPVSVTNFPSVWPVSGTVSVGNFPNSQAVTGPITDTQLRAAPVPVSLASVPSHVVTGPLTNTELRASAVPVSVGNFPSTQTVVGPLTNTELRASAVPVSGTVTVGNFPSTQPVSAVVLPLPTGAASETTLAAVNTKTPALGQAAMAASSPVVIASNQSAVPTSAVPAGATQFQAAGAAGGIINTTAVVVNAAPGAAARNYLRSLQLANGSTTISSEVVVLDGAAVIWRGFVGTAAQTIGGQNILFDPPLRQPTANTALSIQCLTTAMALRWNAQGWSAP